MKSFNSKFIQASAFIFVLSTASISSYASETIINTLDDSTIVTTIKLKQTTDPLLNPFKIRVTSHQGFVKLQGIVKTQLQFNRAVSQARALQNVKNVDARDLKVQSSNEPLTDNAITAKVKGKLLHENMFNNSNIDSSGITIETKNRQVFLVGQVKSPDVRKTIIHLAESVNNVESVNAAGLTVKRS